MTFHVAMPVLWHITIRLTRPREQLQKTTETVLPESQQEKEVVKVRAQSTWKDWITNSASGLTELLVALSFIPFLVYFMLGWKERMRVATVKLFSPEHRRAADETLGAMASMLHGFLAGNLLCGLFVAGGCVLAFGFLKIPYFYFLGFLSGFLSLVPYLGTVLAMLPPLAVGIGTLSGPGMLAVGFSYNETGSLILRGYTGRAALHPPALTTSLKMRVCRMLSTLSESTDPRRGCLP